MEQNKVQEQIIQKEPNVGTAGPIPKENQDTQAKNLKDKKMQKLFLAIILVLILLLLGLGVLFLLSQSSSDENENSGQESQQEENIDDSDDETNVEDDPAQQLPTVEEIEDVETISFTRTPSEMNLNQTVATFTMDAPTGSEAAVGTGGGAFDEYNVSFPDGNSLIFSFPYEGFPIEFEFLSEVGINPQFGTIYRNQSTYILESMISFDETCMDIDMEVPAPCGMSNLGDIPVIVSCAAPADNFSTCDEVMLSLTAEVE